MTKIVQGHVVGKEQWVPVGTGHHGPIHLTFSQPQRSDTLMILDDSTGETRFVPAQKAEKQTGGRIHSQDFPRAHRIQATGIDCASVVGAQFDNVKHARREHWPLEQRGDEHNPLFRLRKLVVGGGGFKTNIGAKYKKALGAQEQASQKKTRRRGHDGITF